MTESIVLAQCLISIMALMLLWNGPVATLRKDSFRARIRRIRDELFDYVTIHGRTFDDPAYRAVRQSLNGMIRLSNYFNVFTFLHAVRGASQWAQLSEGHAKLEHFQEQIDLVSDEELKSHLKSAMKKAGDELLTFIFLQQLPGVLLLLVTLPLFVFAAFIAMIKKAIARWNSRAIEQIERMYNFPLNLPKENRLVTQPVQDLFSRAYTCGGLDGTHSKRELLPQHACN